MSRLSVLLLILSMVMGFPAKAQTLFERMSRLEERDRAWIEQSCKVARDIGPGAYADCLERQLAGIERLGGESQSDSGRQSKPVGSNTTGVAVPSRNPLPIQLGNSSGARGLLGGTGADRAADHRPAAGTSEAKPKHEIDCPEGRSGRLKGPSAIKATPASRSDTVVTGSPGDSVFFVTSVGLGGYCRAVHIDSGRTGWIQLRLVTLNPGSAVGRASGIFERSDSQSAGDPKVSIKNSASRRVTLDIDERSIEVPTGSSTSIVLRPGTYRFHATAPGAVPLLGEQAFEDGAEYAWTFYIETRRSRR